MQANGAAAALPRPRLVLFDLDGTLADTAPDLVSAVRAVGREYNLTEAPNAPLRALVGSGSSPMLKAAFGEDPGIAHSQLVARFLAYYARDICVETRPFAGITATLEGLAKRGIAWGVVTNKPHGLAQAVMYHLFGPASCKLAIGSGCAAAAKPQPHGLWQAAERAGVHRQQTWYVGDDQRDIVAAHAAGMLGLAADWGYIPPGETTATWNADLRLDQPITLLQAIDATA